MRVILKDHEGLSRNLEAFLSDHECDAHSTHDAHAFGRSAPKAVKQRSSRGARPSGCKAARGLGPLIAIFYHRRGPEPPSTLIIPRGQLAIWAIDLANFSSILLLKRPFHDITGRTMANPASTPTDAVGSSPADSESREAATRPQNAPLATTATAGHHGPRTSPDRGGGMGEDGVESDQRLSVS